jgi:ComF family protein
MRLLNTILDLIFPTNCLSCDKRGEILCRECISSSPPALRESADWIFPFFDYRHPPIKKAIWLLKYKNKKSLARVFAEAMYGNILQELADLEVMENFKEPLLIPIPLEKIRRKERGFNQAEVMCEELIKIDTGKNFELRADILIKIKETKHQARIENRSERLKNIVGSFALRYTEQNKTELKGKNIILIDDVSTTGATLSEAKKILRGAGARKVIAFTVAH